MADAKEEHRHVGQAQLKVPISDWVGDMSYFTPAELPRSEITPSSAKEGGKAACGKNMIFPPRPDPLVQSNSRRRRQKARPDHDDEDAVTKKSIPDFAGKTPPAASLC